MKERRDEGKWRKWCTKKRREEEGKTPIKKRGRKGRAKRKGEKKVDK